MGGLSVDALRNQLVEEKNRKKAETGVRLTGVCRYRAARSSNANEIAKELGGAKPTPET